ncbi:MAG: hypothetical protein ACUVS4_05750 [Chloroflexaceae bacterium]
MDPVQGNAGLGHYSQSPVVEPRARHVSPDRSGRSLRPRWRQLWWQQHHVRHGSDLWSRHRPRRGQPHCSCEGGRTSGVCYRQWYTGFDNNGGRRIGLAHSPDGIIWTRVVGAGGLGSVLGFGPAGRFDSANTSFPTVI